jgi:hypothetical protein
MGKWKRKEEEDNELFERGEGLGWWSLKRGFW